MGVVTIEADERRRMNNENTRRGVAPHTVAARPDQSYSSK
jgi:hypothetical protein